MNTSSRLARALPGAVTSLGVLAMFIYAWVTGFSLLAHTVAPGMWGYFGAAGFLILTCAAIPAIMFAFHARRLRRGLAAAVLVGAAWMAIAVVAGRSGWPSWGPMAVVSLTLAVYLVVRLIASLPVHYAGREAVKLLRRQRPDEDQRWSWQDWEWAYTQVGSPAALQQAALLRTVHTASVGRAVSPVGRAFTLE